MHYRAVAGPACLPLCALSLVLKLVFLPTTALADAKQADTAQADLPPSQVLDLKLGQKTEQEITSSEKHIFQATIPIGSAYLVTADQFDVDLVLSLISPAGVLLKTVDTPISGLGSESVVFRPQSTGVYQIIVSAKRIYGRPGRYTIRLSPIAVQTARDRRWLAAAMAMSKAGEFNVQATAESYYQAVDEYRSAENLWNDLREHHLQAISLHCIAQLERGFGEMGKAQESFDEAILLWRSLGEPALEAAALNDLGLTHLDLGEPNSARLFLEQSAKLSRELDDVFSEAVTRSNLCMNALATGRVRDALPCYERVLDLHRQAGETGDHARVLLNLGWIHGTLGQPQQALDHLQLGLDILRVLKDQLGEAQALNNIGYIYENLSELQTALDHYSQSLELLRQVGDRWWTARLLNNIGHAYWGLGDFGRAHSFFQEALSIRREVEDRRGEATTLIHLGNLDLHQGKAQAALEAYDQALLLTRKTSYRQKEGAVLDFIGQALATLGDRRRAANFLDRSLVIAREVGDRQAEAKTLLHQGQLQVDLESPEQALITLEKALQIHRAVQFQQGEAQVLYELARAHQQLGQSQKALDHVADALQLIETLRTRVSSPTLRAAFLSTRRDAYGLQIDLLMSRHFAAPRAGFDREAFTVSERARARSLLDLLSETNAEIYTDVEPALLSQRDQCKQRLNAKAVYQQKVLARAHTEEEAAAARLEFNEALTELENLEALIRRQEPRLGELTKPRFVGPTEVQELLDPNTLLLEYSLGKERSFLWVIGKNTISSVELPPREDIETRARRVYEELSILEVGRSPEPSSETQALANLLLGPLAERLNGQRLIVVADGALHYLPFAALPTPARPAARAGEPLIARHEVIHLPSASTLMIQRRVFSTRPPADKSLAVLADPVFQLSDVRLGKSSLPAKSQVETRAKLERSGRLAAPLTRLPSSRVEAESIIKFLPQEDFLLALDFNANKSTVLDGQLSGYRILHLATHGVIDAERPELSGIALSQFDANGRQQDGFIRLHATST